MQVPRSGGSSPSSSSDSDDDKHTAPERQRPPSCVSPASPAPLGAADAAEPGPRLAGSFAEDGERPAAGALPAGLGGSRRGNGVAAAAAALRKRLLKRGAAAEARALAPAAVAGDAGDADADNLPRAASRAAEQPAPAGSPAGSGSDSGGAAPAPTRKQLLKRRAAGALPPAALASEMEDADAADILRPGAGAGEQPPGAGSPSALVAAPRMRAGRMLSSSEEDSDEECSGRGDSKRRVPAFVSKRARHAPADGEMGTPRSPGAEQADPAGTPRDEDMAACAPSGGSPDATPGRHSGGTPPAHSGGAPHAEAHSPSGSGVARKRSRSSKLPNKRPRSGAAAPGRSSPSAGSGPDDGRSASDPQADQAAAAALSPGTHHAAPMDLGVEGGSDGGGAGGSQDGNAAAARGGSVPFALQRSSTATPDANVDQHDCATADAPPLADSSMSEQPKGGAGGALNSSAPVAGTPGEDAALDDEAGRLLRGLDEEAEAEALWQARDENQAPRNIPGCDAPILRSACLLQQVPILTMLCYKSVSDEMLSRLVQT